MKLIKGLIRGLGFVLLGILGGMLWQTIVIPYLAEQPQTRDLWFVRNYRERQVILYPKQETIIKENEAVTEAIKKVEPSVVSIKSGSVEGSGLVYTTDGLIVAFSELVPASGDFSVWVGERRLKVSVEKRDTQQGLVLLRAEGNGFTTISFASVDRLEKGERVFMVGTRFSNSLPVKVVNEGIVREVQEDFIYTNITDKPYMQGSILFDIQGRVLGMNRIGLEGEVLTLPISTIEQFVSS